MTPNIAEAVLGVARLDEYEGLAFSVGPAGVRVGFAFQQRRALNLVLALQMMGYLDLTKRIAVIGGGLAGATAKMALHGLGYAHAELLTVTDGPLAMQRSATHRIIHPHYGDWPIVDEFESTTDLPFLNWAAGSAAEVAEETQENWDGYKQVLGSVMSAKKVGTLELINAGAPSAHIKISTSANGTEPSQHIGNYDLVIVATGFGTEENLALSKSDSYWEEDRLSSFRENYDDAGYVSGIGDGGLMDFIRLCCRDITQGRHLSLEVMARLRHPKYAMPRPDVSPQPFELSAIEKELRRIEDRAAKMLPDAPPASPRPEFGSDNDNAIARYLAAEYERLIIGLPYEIKALLDKSMLEHPQRMRLIGRLEFPYTCTSAPINKLIVAYILHRFPNSYLRGYVETKHKEQARLIAWDNAISRPFNEGEFVILRHGGNPPVYRFSQQYRDRNARLSRGAANLVDVDRSDVSFCPHLLRVASDNSASDQFVEFRLRQSVQFCRRYLGVAPSIRTSDGPQGTKPKSWFEVDPGRAEFDREQAYLKLGGFPQAIFGIPIIAVPAPQVKSALRRRK